MVASTGNAYTLNIESSAMITQITPTIFINVENENFDNIQHEIHWNRKLLL
jgi:hypothetical protein